MKKSGIKKVLIITYYWPPAGGPGVQRVLNFVKHLPENGWDPIVLTVADGEYPALDKSLNELISSDTSVITTKSIEPFSLYKKLLGKEKDHKIDTYILNQKQSSLPQNIMKWIRLNVFIPDARIGWIPFAVRSGKKIIKEEGVDLIYTCSPPHSLQLIGKKLSKKMNVPWVADFRDPWTSLVAYQGQNRSKLTLKLDSALENSVFTKANRIVVTCKGLKKSIVSSNNVDPNSISVITNGYEKESKSSYKNSSNNVVIFYAGNLSVVRIPYALLDALESIKEEATKANVEFRIAGNVCEEFWNLVREKGIEDMVNYIGYLSHAEVISNYDTSDFLLQVVDDVSDNHLFIAGKLFDYLGSKKPILAIGPKGGEVEEIINETKSGYFFEYSEGAKLKEQLLEILNFEIDIETTFSFTGIEKYSRSALTKRLAHVFDELCV